MTDPRDTTKQFPIDAFIDTGSSRSYLSPAVFDSKGFPHLGVCTRHISQFYGTIHPDVIQTKIHFHGLGAYPVDVTMLANIMTVICPLPERDREFLKDQQIGLQRDPSLFQRVECEMVIGQDIINDLRVTEATPLRLPSGMVVERFRYGNVWSGMASNLAGFLPQIAGQKFKGKHIYAPIRLPEEDHARIFAVKAEPSMRKKMELLARG